MSKKQATEFIGVPVLFFLIYYQVFTADYFYLDEIHQLWHNTDGSNYTMFTTSGRWLTGLLFNKLFASIHEISQIRYLRIFSFSGWILLTVLWQIIFSKWVRKLNADRRLILLMNIYIICCVPVAIYVGWAACMEMFIGVATGLLSGHLLFKSLFEKQGHGKTPVITIVGSLVTGVISLFIYQNMFGIFLFPFFMYYLNRQETKPGRIILTGAFFYLLVYVAYFILFKYSLKIDELKETSRAGISTDIIGKLSFLFSDPLPSAFSVNFLYTARSIFSQILSPLIMITWAVSVFIRYGKQKLSGAFLHILFVLIFLVLMYLPSMIALENFASYRTLFVFNLAVFYLLIDQFLFFCNKQRQKQILMYSTCLLLLATGFYNYNFQFVNPLKAEHRAFISFMNKVKQTDLQTVYFIRADRFMFKSFYHTLPYKDELGAPSTSRDWVPEPLVKQYLLETTGSRSLSEKIKLVQFADSSEYNNAKVQQSPGNLVIDMNIIFRDYINQYN